MLQRFKYPKTFHLPWSPGISRDDRIINNLDPFKDKEVIVTIKMDGENTTLYRDGLHARSLDFKSHPSRTWIKTLWSKIALNIPEGWRICGENLFATHSIQYKNLEDLFLVFSIWNENNECLNWDDTIEWSNLLELKMVPIIYKGLGNKILIENLYQKEFNNDPCEGYVVRLFDSFKFNDFQNSICKYVRKNHIQTNEHWLNQKMKLNEIKIR